MSQRPSICEKRGCFIRPKRDWEEWNKLNVTCPDCPYGPYCDEDDPPGGERITEEELLRGLDDLLKGLEEKGKLAPDDPEAAGELSVNDDSDSPHFDGGDAFR